MPRSRLSRILGSPATMMLIGVAHVACASGQPRPSPAPRPAVQKSAPPAAPVIEWSTLPLDVQTGELALQTIFEQTSAAMATLGAENRNWDSERDAFALRKTVAELLGPTLSLLRETWFQTRSAHPELIPFETAHLRRSEQLQEAARRRGERTALPAAPGHVALGGLLVELLAQAVAADRKSPDGVPDSLAVNAWRDRTLEVLRWATTREAMYASAFDILGAPWVGSSSTKGPWAAQVEALKRLPTHLASEGGKSGLMMVEGARLGLEGAPGHVMLKAADISDRGLPGMGGNGVLDAGEILELTMRFMRTAGVGPLFGESVVPTVIPPCVVVTSPEIVLDEAESGEEATANAKVLISGRCSREVRIGYAAQSTHGATTNVTLVAAPMAAGPITTAFILDADLPGHSVPGDVSIGLRAGQRVEMTPTLAGTNGYDGVELRSLLHAEPRDKGYVSFGPLRTGVFSPKGAVLTLEDDLDLTVARENSLRVRRDNAVRTSDNLTPFGADLGGLWFALDVSMKRAGRALPPGSPASLNASGRKARDWISARVAAESIDQMIIGLTSAVDTVVARVEALYCDPDWLNPSPAGVLAAMKILMSLDLLTEPEVTALLQRFDVPADVAASIACSLMSGRRDPSFIHPTIAALVDHLDARATGTRPRSATEDEARGVGGRVAMTPAGAAQALEQAVVRSLDGGGARGWDTPARRLARNVLVAGRIAAELAGQQGAIDAMVRTVSGEQPRVRAFPDPLLRAVISQLGLLTLDIRRIPNDLRQILAGHVVTKVLRLERQPDLAVLASLSQLLKEEAAQGKAQADRAELEAASGAIGQQRLRRWFRVPLVDSGT